MLNFAALREVGFPLFTKKFRGPISALPVGAPVKGNSSPSKNMHFLN